LIVAAVATLPARSCLIDGEAIVSDAGGLAIFELLRSWPATLSAVLCAFDLLELDGQDLRRLPIEERKRTLAKLVGRPRPGIALNDHYRRPRRYRLPASLPARLRRHRVEAAGLGVSLRPIKAMGQSQESGGAGGGREAKEDWT
jgi:ATP-dependent DNA ligase